MLDRDLADKLADLVTRLRQRLADAGMPDNGNAGDLLAVLETHSADVVALAERIPRLRALLTDTGLDAAEVIVACELATDHAPRPRPPVAVAAALGWDAPMYRRTARAMFPDGHDLARVLRRLLVLRTPKAERPRCGARTRTGSPCQARAVWDDGTIDRERGGVDAGCTAGCRAAPARPPARLEPAPRLNA